MVLRYTKDIFQISCLTNAAKTRKISGPLSCSQKGQRKCVLMCLIKPKSLPKMFTSTKTESKTLTLFRLLFGLLLRTAATTAAIWSIWNGHTVHTAIIKVTIHVNIILFTLFKKKKKKGGGWNIKKKKQRKIFCSSVHKWPDNYLDVISEALRLKLEPGRKKKKSVAYEKRLKDAKEMRTKNRTEGLTDERFLLLLKPPSLIFRGATFLVFTFFSWGLGAGLDFLRALGPKMCRN